MEKETFREISPETAEDLYENAPCGYISFLGDGTIFRFNKTLISLLGYKKEEAEEIQKFQDLLTIGGKIYFETHFFPLIKIQGFVKEINFDLRKKDGTSFPALINVNEKKGKSNEQSTYSASILDITDRKKYELVLLEAKEKAEQVSRAKAEFLSTISHEIRTPLNAILGIGNLIQNTPLNEVQTEYARILKLSSDNLLGLVNNLLDLSKLEAQKVKLEHKTFSINDLAQVLIQTYKLKATEKKIALEVDFPKNLPKNLIGDPVKLNQILTNLLGNAIKFTRKGFVKLIIEVLDQDKKTVLLNFKVVDTGIGIPEDKLELIFQEFSQASYDVNLEFGGTGLGLTISQKLLQMHDSELIVKSKEGKGTEFAFKIKYEISEENFEKKSRDSKIEEVLSQSGAKILVVDDNPVNTYIATQYLDAWKLESQAVESGEAAIAAVQRTHFDLILMDLHMPKMNGYEVSAAIRKLHLQAQPVIIALSASGRGDLNLKMERAGIDNYVPKPFDPLELQEVLANYLTKKEKQGHEKRVSKIVKSEIPNPPEIKAAEPAFELSRYISIAGEDREVLEKLIGNSIEAMERYKKEFTAAAENKNSVILSEIIHKNTTTIHYIGAGGLAEKIDKFLNLLKDPAANEEDVKKKKTVVLTEFEIILEGLKNFKAKK